MAGERKEWYGRPVEAWRVEWGVPELHTFTSVGSTNDVARDRAEAGAPEGTTVITDEQTRGRGRRGRVWTSHPGQSLVLSMVVRPGTLGAESVLSIRLGLAVARAIEEITPLAVTVKWPNDLLVDGRKVGGMLCEGAVEGDRPAYVVAGTGVNVLQPDEAWSGPLAGRATSLVARAQEPVAIPALAGRVIRRWLDVLDAPGHRLTADELDAFRRRDALAGYTVTVDGEVRGQAVGVDADGTLRLAGPDGRERRVVSGTVRRSDPPSGGEA